MTMQSKVSKAVFSGNGATTDFPFDFKVWDTSELSVTITGPDGASIPATGWTATLTDTGGTVSYRKDGAPLPSGWKLAILRDMPFTQGVDLLSGTRFDPQVIETSLDQACAERQQLLEQLQRAVIIPPTSDETPLKMAEQILQAEKSAKVSAADAKSSESAAASSALQAAASEQAAAESVRQAGDWTELAQAWAESPTPPDPDDPESKSAKEWAKIASNIVPIATTSVAGKVKVGTNLSVADDGTLSVASASTSAKGVVQLSSATNSTSTTLAATASAVKTAYDKGVSAATAASKAQTAADAAKETAEEALNKANSPASNFNKEVIFTSSNANWTAPVSGVYSVTCIGGGGKGGTGGKGYGHAPADKGGGGGGGGGSAGFIKTVILTLTADTVVPITVGGPAGASSFGTYVTSKGGITGAVGKNGGATTVGAGAPVIHEGGGGHNANGRNGGVGGDGAPGYLTSVKATNGAKGSVSRPDTTGGTGGPGGTGYGAGGGGGGGGGQAKNENEWASGGAGGNGAAGAVIVRYTA